MKAIKICENIYWVGGIDWRLRNFHGYLTQRGSSYNAFLIIDEKVTLIDTVKGYLTDEMLSRISSVIDPAKIEVIIANHVEMDHSGALPALAKIAPAAKIYCTPKGDEGLRLHYGELNYVPVKTGESLSIGKHTLSFIQTPMVHWPDNMFTYCPEAKILFSNDAFGQHIASSERFDDEFSAGIIMEEAAKYYANIVLPFSGQVTAALKAVAHLPIDLIAPSHGLLLRTHISEVLKRYQKWSSNGVDEKALIIYDSMWGSTEKIVDAIRAGFECSDVLVEVICLQDSHMSDIMTSVLTAKYICMGSPTLNNSILPTMGGFLAYFKGLAPKNRIAMAFGSFGWSGQSVGIVEDTLKGCGFTMMEPTRVKYVPNTENLAEISQQVVREINRLRNPAPVTE